MTATPPHDTSRENTSRDNTGRENPRPADIRCEKPGPVRPPWLIDRDLDAVAAYLDAWILAAEPDHDPQATAVPLLGTPEWVAADEVTRNASVALYVLACLAEREPVVIAARLAAEIAAGRTAYLVATRQSNQAISNAVNQSRYRRRGAR